MESMLSIYVIYLYNVLYIYFTDYLSLELLSYYYCYQCEVCISLSDLSSSSRQDIKGQWNLARGKCYKEKEDPASFENKSQDMTAGS